MNRHISAGMKTLALTIVLGLTACANVDAPSAPEPVRFAAPTSLGASQPVLASLPPSMSFPVPAEAEPDVSVDDALAEAGDRGRLIRVSKRLNCVAFVRMQSGIQVAGNAGTWWDHARGKYERDNTPQEGAVMVFSSTRKMRSGHVALVRRVVSKREIRIDHANWTNDGQIHVNATVVDVSPNNDWSQVRVWNTRGGSMGTRVYPIKGFVLQTTARAR